MSPRDDQRTIQTIRLLTIDRLPHQAAEGLVARVSRRVSVPCRLDHLPMAADAPLLPGREQADSDHILLSIEALPVGPGEVVVGITQRDIGTRIFSYVFGRARRDGHAALVSVARLTPAFYGLPEDPDLTLRRAMAEVIHEVGHVAGLDHCGDGSCIMRFATNVESIDLRGSDFCEDCARQLPPGLPGRPAFEPDFRPKPPG